MKVKKGCVVVQVRLRGEDYRASQRFIIPITYLYNPFLQSLLDKALGIYDYRIDGPLLLPCSGRNFFISNGGQKILRANVRRQEQKVTFKEPQFQYLVSLGFQKSLGKQLYFIWECWLQYVYPFPLDPICMYEFATFARNWTSINSSYQLEGVSIRGSFRSNQNRT